MAVDRQPPHNIEAEQSTLGSLIIDPDAYIRVAEFLKPDDFYREAHRTVYSAVVDLNERHDPADLITLCDELARRNVLDEVGGPAYITTLVNMVPTSAHVEHYGRIVERTGTLRRLIAAAGQIAGMAFEDSDDIESTLDKAEQTLFAVSQRRLAGDFIPIRALLHDYLDHIDYVHQHRGSVLGVPTGFADLDRLTGGLQPSDLIIIGARPSMGKTALSVSLAHATAMKHQTTVGIFALEMSAEQIVQRFVAIESGVDQQKLRTGNFEDRDLERIVVAAGALSEAPIFIDDTAGISVMEVRAKARRLAAQSPLGMLIIDYLQLMQGRNSRDGNRVQEISEISRSLKGLARELSVPVVALAQLSRGVESRQDHRPMLSDLRESGCLTGDTLIAQASGDLAPIASLVDQRFEVVALDGWRTTTSTATKVWRSGHRPIFKLTTGTGRVLRATGNHPLRTLNGWSPLASLGAGDRVALARRYPEPASGTRWDDDRVILLAHLIGDGCYVPRQPLHYTSASATNLDAVAHAAYAAFGIVGRYVRQENWYHLYLSAGANKWHPNPVRGWLRSLGIDGQRSFEKAIPSEVFTLSSVQVALFLRHLWATDGCVYLNPRESGPKATIYYATTSRVLADQVQHLLARLGIVARVKSTAKVGYRLGFHVLVYGATEQDRFMRTIGGIGERALACERVAASILGVRPNTNVDTIPVGVWNAVKERMTTLGISQRQMAALRGTSYGGSGHFSFSPSRIVLQQYASLLGDPMLQELSQSDVFWDEVRSVVPDGTADVYDMTVPALNNFIANGIVVHNSIEQDADVVMFIYRDEVYNPSTDRQGIADIIVAKHRNGPVGQVSLRWLEQTARFVDLELYRRPDGE